MGEGSQHRMQRYLRFHTHVRSGAASAPADPGRGTAQSLRELRQTEAGGKAGNDLYPPAKQNIRPKTIVFGRTMVEARGVEPLSEDQTAKTSPSAVCVLTFPPPDSRRRDAGLSSFINSHPSQSLNGLVPCIDDAGYLRRRRLRADGHGLSRDGDGIIIVSSF